MNERNLSFKNSIFAHRGAWFETGLTPNSLRSIQSAFTEGFSVELDVRDQSSKVVISHDPCSVVEYVTLEDLDFQNKRMAINIKSDGLSGYMGRYREQLLSTKSFIFDCSIPELLRYRNASIPHAIRISEYERELPWAPQYIWLDAFNSDWWIGDSYVRRLMDKFPTVIVSPELHGRPNEKVWEQFYDLVSVLETVSICTDAPMKLAQFGGYCD